MGNNVVSWTVFSLPFGGSLIRTVSVAASQTITNSDYQVNADGDVGAVGTEAVVTIINEPEKSAVYLPIILKNP